jgi:O-acetyl-ADP-ribose deacetylase (regulator of RNase III)
MSQDQNTTTLNNVAYVTGDIFTTELPALGHGVNIYGVMGSGIAVIVRKTFPKVFPPYAEACRMSTLAPGSMLPVKVTDDKWVLNLASQDKPGPHAKMEWLSSSVRASFEFVQKESIEGFAIPRIGAGIGGLKWEDVKVELENIASEFPNVKLEIWSLPDA